MNVTVFTQSQKFPIFVRQIPDKATAIMRASMTPLRTFCRAEDGQDLIEYTLLMAFVALASALLFLNAGRSIKGIWSSSNSQLSAANVSGS